MRSPLLVNLRWRMIGPRALDPITWFLQALYAPPALIPIFVSIAVAHWWVYVNQGIFTSLRAALFTPGALVTLLALMLAAGPVHELGHAAALRYGGGRARGIGVGLYLVYPVFYTDATDSYRLGRWARVRTDLGGFYFHLIFAVAMVALALASGQPFLQVVLLLADLAILQDCLPFVRWDGYWALADLTGIPDFLSLAAPFVMSLSPSPTAHAASKLPPLKPWAKAVFVIYLVTTLPVLTLMFLFMASRVPSIVGTTAEALSFAIELLPTAWRTADGLLLFGVLTQTVLLVLPLVGLGYSLYAGTRKIGGMMWRFSKPTAIRRIAGGFVTAGLVGVIGYLWVPQLPLDDWLPSTRPAPPEGVQSFVVPERQHVTSSVEYAQTPPVGGNHAPIWQNCGFYDSPIANEYAVHSLEHGAVWITYRPDLTQDQVAVLSDLANSRSYVLVSPYPDLPAPVVVSAWGRQLQLGSAEDPRLTQFVRGFRNGAQAPEQGGPCTGGVGEPT